MLKKLGFVGIMQIVNAVISNIILIPILIINGNFEFLYYIRWAAFGYILCCLLTNTLFSQHFISGKFQELVVFFSASLLISTILAYILFSLYRCNFSFQEIDWVGSIKEVVNLDWVFAAFNLIIFIAFVTFYATVIDKRMLNLAGTGGLKGSGKLKTVESNLENSRWLTNEEKNKLFKPCKYSKLSQNKKDGIPVGAALTNRKKDLNVLFNSPCHSLIIGSTGSGKTTTFVSPMIQLLGASAAGSSMIMTDPKGELFSLHSGFLKSRGYDVKVVDLRDTYSSYRWNPLETIWDNYQKYLNAENMVYQRSDDVATSELKMVGDPKRFEGLDAWYEFNGKAYSDFDEMVQSVKVFQKQIFDEVYEDMNDLVSVLIPVENQNDPMWEKGARSITQAVLLGMLEDSEDENLHMTKDKFNFFNLAKILQNSSDDYLELRKYFGGRDILSKAYSLSKQVCDAAETTRASYMSIVYEKLTMFNDAGICALTSSSDFTAEQLAYKPTALFLKIPDEKDTRHNLAAIFILNIYKTLIKVASSFDDLSLPRNVYFILDEFGNMPKIEKFDKMITVGRSRKIWFNMIIQSYAQLDNVYGDKVGDIVKGNCGIKMFIGSNDMNTCKEYSELCGNITVVTKSTSGQGKDVNVSNQLQQRPLIYPSELQRLNHPGDIGHSIVVTFGNYPLMTYFSPSFVVPFYKIGKMDTSELSERFFDEDKLLYDVKVRNRYVEGSSSSAESNASPDLNQNKEEVVSVENKEENQEIKSEDAINEEAKDASNITEDIKAKLINTRPLKTVANNIIKITSNNENLTHEQLLALIEEQIKLNKIEEEQKEES